MFSSLDKVSPEELADIKKTVSEMNQQVDPGKGDVFRFTDYGNGRISVRLSDPWGQEGLAQLFIVLRRLKRFQK